MCTYRNISGSSDINTKICEQCGMAITEWLWIGIGMCWCSRASTRGGMTTCTWFSTYNQQVETGHACIRCRSQKNETRHWGNHGGIGDFADWNLCYLDPANPIFWRDYSQMVSYVDARPWCMSCICPVYVICCLCMLYYHLCRTIMSSVYNRL